MSKGGHAARAHAKLSASGSKRWLACPPSVRLEESLSTGEAEKTSVYAEEGTAAHEYSEILIAYELGLMNKATYTRTLAKFTKELPKKLGQFYSEEELENVWQEMQDQVPTYVDYVVERANAMRAISTDALTLIEQRLDFSKWVPGGFGTGDILLIADGRLEIIDLKYGKGVPVDAFENTQMMLYGLGALHEHDMLYDLKEISMTIVQPRLDSISTYTTTAEALYEWAEGYVKPRAELAENGEGDFQAGEHCLWCKAKALCRARAEKNLELAKHDFADPDLLTPEEIADILFKTDELKKWAKDIEDYALDQAEKNGVVFDGWKLVEGRSNRKYADEKAVTEKLLEDGQTEEAIYKKSLLSITDMEKKLGKKKFTDLLGELIVKPQGKPTLVPETDKRPALNTAESAKSDFDAIDE